MTLDTLEFFRTRFGGRPLLLVIAVMGLLLLSRRRRPDLGVTTWWTVVASRVVGGAGFLGLIAYVAVALSYASTVHYFDNAEPTMTAVGWLFHVGQPVYHPVESAERYAHIYGPAAFIAHGFALGILGPSIISSKVLGVTAALTSLALLGLTLRSEVSLLRSIVLTGVGALVLLLFRNYSFWTRAEPLQLLCVSAALLFAVRANAVAAAVVVGACAGILWTLKITGALYALPIFVVLHHRTGRRCAMLAFGVAVVVALLPFAVFTNVSWSNYVHWIRLSARTGVLLSTLRANIEWAAFLLVPILFSYYALPAASRRGSREWWVLLLAIGLATCGVVLTAAKPGAGPYHLIPTVPLIIYAVAYQLKDATADNAIDPSVAVGTIAFMGVTLVVGSAQQAEFLSTMAQRAARDEATDAARFASDHPGVVEMGYGSSEALSLQRPVLVFRNNSYALDQPAVREHQLAGLELPETTIQALRECRVNYWLVPRGEAPFSGRNAYDAVLLRPLFPDEFRRVFRQTHALAATTRYFDVWRCESQASR